MAVTTASWWGKMQGQWGGRGGPVSSALSPRSELTQLPHKACSSEGDDFCFPRGGSLALSLGMLHCSFILACSKASF